MTAAEESDDNEENEEGNEDQDTHNQDCRMSRHCLRWVLRCGGGDRCHSALKFIASNTSRVARRWGVCSLVVSKDGYDCKEACVHVSLLC